jgi:hypothetical protein
MARRRNRGQFKPGFDPRRHIFTAAERKRGGIQCAKKYTVCGRWHLDWMDQCSKRNKGEY